jgi:hypothetical protein
MVGREEKRAVRMDLGEIGLTIATMLKRTLGQGRARQSDLH